MADGLQALGIWDTITIDTECGCHACNVHVSHYFSLSLQFCFCLQRKSFLADCNVLQLGDDITIKTSDWLKGEATFDQWRAGLDTRSEQSNEELRKRRLVEKFARIWRMKTIKGNKRAYMTLLLSL